MDETVDTKSFFLGSYSNRNVTDIRSYWFLVGMEQLHSASKLLKSKLDRMVLYEKSVKCHIDHRIFISLASLRIKMLNPCYEWNDSNPTPSWTSHQIRLGWPKWFAFPNSDCKGICELPWVKNFHGLIHHVISTFNSWSRNPESTIQLFHPC